MDKLDLDDMDIEELRHCCPSPELVEKLRRLGASPFATGEAADNNRGQQPGPRPLKSLG